MAKNKIHFIFSEFSDGTLKFVFADYSKSAVVYVCLSVGSDGRCRQEHLEVYVLSRTVAVEAHAFARVYKHVRSTSALAADLHTLDTGSYWFVSWVRLFCILCIYLFIYLFI